MRLYQNSKGQWFGTQADARRNSPKDWREVEVPTSKQELLNWLNLHNFGSKPAGLAPEPDVEAKPEAIQPTNKISANPNRYDLMDASDAASLQDLQTVMYRYLMRVDDALDLKRIENEQKGEA
tara:strand:- start:135 stop:503 length:369 start_codon:yes stop_codon:yes gene_type:complete